MLPASSLPLVIGYLQVFFGIANAVVIHVPLTRSGVTKDGELKPLPGNDVVTGDLPKQITCEVETTGNDGVSTYRYPLIFFKDDIKNALTDKKNPRVCDHPRDASLCRISFVKSGNPAIKPIEFSVKTWVTQEGGVNNYYGFEYKYAKALQNRSDKYDAPQDEDKKYKRVSCTS